MKRSAALFTAFVVAGTVSALAATAQVGKPAPDFTAKDIHGKAHKLSDYKSKIVVLEAYNLDCPFCANHFKTGAMQELQKEVTSKGGIWLVINSTHSKNGSYRNPEAAQNEFKVQNMHATAWIDDHSGEVGRLYGLKTTPDMVVIDEKGVIAYMGAIDDRPSPGGDPRKARNYVREAVESLRAGEEVKVKKEKPYGCGIKYGT